MIAVIQPYYGLAPDRFERWLKDDDSPIDDMSSSSSSSKLNSSSEISDIGLNSESESSVFS